MHWLNLWAKTNDFEINQALKSGISVPDPKIHPLLYHLIDVGLVAEAWLDLNPKLLDRFVKVCGLNIPRDELHRLIVLCTSLHDLGKCSPRFQSKSEIGWKSSYGMFGDEKRIVERFNHGLETLCICKTICEYDTVSNSTTWASILPMIQVSAGHHGILFESAQESLFAISSNGKLIIEGLLKSVEKVFGLPVLIRNNPSEEFLIMLAGFVSICDWIGSNANYFNYTRPNLSDIYGIGYATKLRKSSIAKKAIRECGLIASYKDALSFGQLFSSSGVPWVPKKGFQQKAIEIPFGKSSEGELLIIEAPMGIGKTEIALFHAAQALSFSDSDGVYFALPTQATSNALFPRVLQFSKTISDSDHISLVLAHGGRRFFEDFQDIVRKSDAFYNVHFSSNHAYLESDSSEVISPKWLQSSKRTLLSPIGIGTIDQSLVSVMSVKHSFVRLFALSGKVVIFDEVHAYDVYMSTILNKLIARMGVLGTKVILLSATLPNKLKRKLLESYSGRSATKTISYPVAIHAHGAKVDIILDSDDKLPNTDIEIEIIEPSEGQELVDAGVNFVLEAYRRGGCIAWIRNTVKDAQNAARELRSIGAEVELIHARYTRVDRNMKEEQLLKLFGKPSPQNESRPKARIVVATQVIEQSVDVDFDVMLSDIAPVDLLLQRSGRLHRHERLGFRSGHETARLGILMPNSVDRSELKYGNSVYVYDPEILARTAVVVLQGTRWTLPSACRTLVDAVYEPDSHEWSAEALSVNPEKLDQVGAKRLAREKEMVSLARKTFMTEIEGIPIMRDPKPDGGDDAGYVSYSTRLGSQNVFITLIVQDGTFFRLWASHTFLLESEEITTELEYQVALSTVSVRDVGVNLSDQYLPDALGPFVRAWRASNPWERRIFVLINQQGDFQNNYIEGTYTFDNGFEYSWKF